MTDTKEQKITEITKLTKLTELTKCEWFNNEESKISELLPYFPITINNHNSNFFNDINHSKSETIKNKYFVVNKDEINMELYKEKLIEKKNNSLNKPTITERSIKEINTKYDRLIDNYNNVIRTASFKIFPNYEQQQLIFLWMNECTKVYNESVNMYNRNELNLNYKISKLEVFKNIYGESDKDAPYDMLTDEVRSCCSNIKSCITNIKNKNITHFKITHKNNQKSQSILIPKKSIYKNGIFKQSLGDIKGFDKINTDLIECDSRLIYDKKHKQFILKCPIYRNKINVHNRHSIVALDPGEKIFMSYYSLNNCGHIGDNLRKKLLHYQTKIKILQRNLKKNKNKKENKIRNKRKVKYKIDNYYARIKNIVKELHNKTALYLVTNYDKILIPEFGTANMVKCFGKNFIKKKVKEIKETMTIEEQKREFKKYSKIKTMSKQSKFLLNSLSHYKFRQHLLNKAEEYGCSVKIVTEEFTSKCCSNCGILSDKYNYRLKICENCNLKIDRDLNGSRNILIKNWRDNYRIIKKTCMSCM
jgi:putative transposase